MIVNSTLEYFTNLNVSSVPEDKKQSAVYCYGCTLQQIVPGISFEEFKSKILTFEAKLNFKTKPADADRWHWFNAWRRTDYKTEAYAYLKTFKDWKTYYDAGYWASLNGEYQTAFECYYSNNTIQQRVRCISLFNTRNVGSADKCIEVANAFLTANVNDNTAIGVIDHIVDNMVGNPAFDEVKVKALIKNINRKFSKKLITDKAKWEPVIAKVRTTLETL